MRFQVEDFTNIKETEITRIFVGDMLTSTAQSYPDRPAILSWEGAYTQKENQILTWKQVEEKCNQFAHALIQKGLKKNDRVVLYGLSSSEYALAMFGIMKAGGVCFHINIMSAADILVYMLRKMEPKFVVCDADLYPSLADALKANGLKVDITIDIGGDAIDGSVTFCDFIKDKPISPPEEDCCGSDVAQVMFTAGTTSYPKAAMHTHAHMCIRALAGSVHFGADAPSRTLEPYPLYHITNTPLLVAAAYGQSVILVHRFTPQAALEALNWGKPNIMFVGPVHFYQMIEMAEKNAEKYDLSSLNRCVYFWSSFDPAYLDRLEKLTGHHVDFRGISGQTEAGYNYFRHDDYQDLYRKNEPEINYWGKCQPLWRHVVMDESGKILPPGEPGEIVYRSPAVMCAYYGDEAETEKAFAHGWFHSGDAGYEDENGLLIQNDRVKDIVKSGGENVSSMRVEAVLGSHPGVELPVAIIGIPDKQWGELVLAVVVPKKDAKVSEEELIKYCRERLAGFETPKKIVFVDQLPIVVGSKVQKYKLREQYKHIFAAEEGS